MSSAKRPRPSGTCATPRRATRPAAARDLLARRSTISPVCRTVPGPRAASSSCRRRWLRAARRSRLPRPSSETPCSALTAPYRASTPRSSSRIARLARRGRPRSRPGSPAPRRACPRRSCGRSRARRRGRRPTSPGCMWCSTSRIVRSCRAEAADQLGELADLLVVEPAGGLVEQEQRRLGDERARELDALQRPEGEAARPAARRARQSSRYVEHLSAPAARPRARAEGPQPRVARRRARSRARSSCGKSTTFWKVRATPRRDDPVAGVEQVLAVVAGSRPPSAGRAGDHVEERRLPRAVSAVEPDDLSLSIEATTSGGPRCRRSAG